MGKICPVCRAPIPETSIVCEYCGTSIQSQNPNSTSKGEASTEPSELAVYVREANEHITRLKRLVQPSYKMIGMEEKTVDKAEQSCRHISVFAGDNKKVAEIVDEMKELIDKANMRLQAASQRTRSKSLVLTVCYFAAVILVLVALIWVGHVVSPDSMKTWVVGGLALLGLVVGAVLGAIPGAIGGAIVGGLLGFLMQWFLMSLAGNVILGVVWLAGFIVLYFTVIKDRIS